MLWFKESATVEDMRQKEDWPSFAEGLKQGLEPVDGQHICHWQGQRDCQITTCIL